MKFDIRKYIHIRNRLTKSTLSNFMITLSIMVLLMAHFIQMVFNLEVEQKENCTIKFPVFLI